MKIGVTKGKRKANYILMNNKKENVLSLNKPIFKHYIKLNIITEC